MRWMCEGSWPARAWPRATWQCSSSSGFTVPACRPAEHGKPWEAGSCATWYRLIISRRTLDGELAVLQARPPTALRARSGRRPASLPRFSMLPSTTAAAPIDRPWPEHRASGCRNPEALRRGGADAGVPVGLQCQPVPGVAARAVVGVPLGSLEPHHRRVSQSTVPFPFRIRYTLARPILSWRAIWVAPRPSPASRRTASASMIGLRPL